MVSFQMLARTWALVEIVVGEFDLGKVKIVNVLKAVSDHMLLN